MPLSRPTAPWISEVKSELFASQQLVDSPRLTQALTRVIQMLRHQEHWSAFEAARELLKSHHWSGALHYCAGYAAQRLGERELAQSHYARVIERDRLGSLAAQELMISLYQKREYEELIAFSRSRLTLMEEPETYYMLGAAYQAGSHHASAQVAFERALQTSYKSSLDYINYRLALAGSLYLQRDVQGALTLLSAAERPELKYHQLWLLIARCHFRLQRESDGDQALQRALKLAPKSAQVHISCGDEWRIRDPKRALKHYHHVLRRYQAPAEVYRRVSEIYENNHDLKRALQYMQLYRDLIEYHEVASIDQRLDQLKNRLKAQRSKNWYQRFYGRR